MGAAALGAFFLEKNTIAALPSRCLLAAALEVVVQIKPVHGCIGALALLDAHEADHAQYCAEEQPGWQLTQGDSPPVAQVELLERERANERAFGRRCR